MTPRPWPDLLRDYTALGGVLDFAWFDQVADGPDAQLACIAKALEPHAPVNAEALARLPKRRLTPNQFLGTWYDPAQGELVWVGTVTTASGHLLENPPFRLLRKEDWQGCSSVTPEGTGEFAYAFSNPPYSLQGSYQQIAALFLEFRDALLAGGPALEIDDYGSERLVEVSPYFEAGAEWWGTFLWTIHDWRQHRFCVILGSTTD